MRPQYCAWCGRTYLPEALAGNRLARLHERGHSFLRGPDLVGGGLLMAAVFLAALGVVVSASFFVSAFSCLALSLGLCWFSELGAEAYAFSVLGPKEYGGELEVLQRLCPPPQGFRGFLYWLEHWPLRLCELIMDARP